MIISNEIYKAMMNRAPKSPPEVGGILGKDRNIVTCFEYDNGIATDKLCTYVPDVVRLNNVIEKWSEQNISFCGIFHTHFFGVRTLSDGDKKYINNILSAMPNTINRLYFPIVLPETKEMVVYLAIRSGEKIRIVEDVIEII